MFRIRFPNDLVVGRQLIRLGQALEQVGARYPVHRPRLIVQPGLACAGEKTTEDLPAFECVTPQDGEWIAVRTLGQGSDITRSGFKG